MRSVILVAIFGFVLALGLAIAARRPPAAVLVVLVGAGWPATLDRQGRGLGAGVAILLAVLVVLAGLTSRRVPRVAAPAAIALAVAAIVVSSSSAVARGELVGWQHWDFYNAPAAPVSVSYVWNAQYDGLRFPRKRTTVLEIKAPATGLYGERWSDARGRPLGRGSPSPGDLRPASRDRKMVRQDVTVEALADTHPSARRRRA